MNARAVPVLLLVLCLAKSSAGAASPAPVVETYQVNATYSDVAKKKFRRIGTGTVTYAPEERSRFGIAIDGRVKHPEREDEYVFHTELKFSLEGKNLRLLVDRSRYNDRAREYKDRVEHMAPFVYLARFLPVPSRGEDPSREYRLIHLGGPGHMVRYRTDERGDVELTVREGDDPVGTFLLAPGAGLEGNAIRRFTVRAGKLSFVFLPQQSPARAGGR